MRSMVLLESLAKGRSPDFRTPENRPSRQAIQSLKTFRVRPDFNPWHTSSSPANTDPNFSPT
jgi:hypothetical protein